MDYNEDIKLSKFKLDDACEKQSSLFLQYADLLATSKNELNDLKNQRRVIRAAANRDIKLQNPKATIPDLASLVELDVKVQFIEDSIVKAQYKVDAMEGVVESFRQRKSMINDLVQLGLAGFFSDPTGKLRVNRAQAEQINYLKEK